MPTPHSQITHAANWRGSFAAVQPSLLQLPSFRMGILLGQDVMLFGSQDVAPAPRRAGRRPRSFRPAATEVGPGGPENVSSDVRCTTIHSADAVQTFSVAPSTHRWRRPPGIYSAPDEDAPTGVSAAGALAPRSTRAPVSDMSSTSSCPARTPWRNHPNSPLPAHKEFTASW